MSNTSLAETDSNILLKAIYEKLEHIENRLVKAEEFMYAGQNIIATSVDSVDSIMTGTDNSIRFEKIKALLNKLTSDEILDKFIMITDRFEQIAPLLEKDNLVQIVVDTIDDISSRLKNSGIEISTVILNLAKVLPKILDDKAIELIATLLDKTNLLIYDESFNKITNDLQSIINLDKSQKIIEGIKLSIEEVNDFSEKTGFIDIIKLLNNPEVRRQIYLSLLSIKKISDSLKK